MELACDGLSEILSSHVVAPKGVIDMRRFLFYSALAAMAALLSACSLTFSDPQPQQAPAPAPAPVIVVQSPQPAPNDDGAVLVLILVMVPITALAVAACAYSFGQARGRASVMPASYVAPQVIQNAPERMLGQGRYHVLTEAEYRALVAHGGQAGQYLEARRD